jgi:ribosomal protein L25 (general stress protein Ctc)
MRKPKTDKARELRIDNEIIVDCYGEAERAMGWYCNLAQQKSKDVGL